MSEINKIGSILSSGISLFELGVNNWALTKEQSFQALIELENANIPVLGGDIYEMTNGVPESNYDNWYCEKEETETLKEFVSRSIKYANSYIENYKSPSGQEALFVLVA